MASWSHFWVVKGLCAHSPGELVNTRLIRTVRLLGLVHDLVGARLGPPIGQLAEDGSGTDDVAGS